MGPSVKFVSSINGSSLNKKIMGQLFFAKKNKPRGGGADIGENSRSRNVSRELASRILARPQELIFLFLAPML